MNFPYRLKLVTRLDDPWLASLEYAGFVEHREGVDSVLLSLQGMQILAPVYLHKNMSLFFVAVLQQDQVVALLPLVLETKQLLPGIRLKRLHFWGKATRCYSEHPCPRLLIAQGHAAQAVCTFLSEKMHGELSPAWDCWYLSDIYEEGSGLTELRASGFDFRPEASFFKAFELCSRDLGEDQDLLTWLSGNTRKLVRRGMRNAEQFTPPIQHVVMAGVSDDMLERIAGVHSARQQAKAAEGQERNSFFEDPVERAVVREFLDYASSEKALSVHVLRSGEDLMAATFLFGKGAEAAHYFYIWTSELQGLEGARLLWYKAMEYELQQKRRLRIVHGRGENETKRSFSSQQFPLVCGHILNPAVLSRLRWFLLSVFRVARDLKNAAVRKGRASSARLFRKQGSLVGG